MRGQETRPDRGRRVVALQVPEGRRHLRQPEGAREPADGRLLAPRPRTKRAQRCIRLFPRLGGAWAKEGGAQRRRADAGHRTAIMAELKLLLLDEPSLGLAPKIVQVFAAIAEIAASSITILLVEQNTWPSRPRKPRVRAGDRRDRAVGDCRRCSKTRASAPPTWSEDVHA